MSDCLCLQCFKRYHHNKVTTPIDWNTLIGLLSYAIWAKADFRVEKTRKHLKRLRKRLAQDRRIIREIEEIEKDYPGAWEEIRSL